MAERVKEHKILPSQTLGMDPETGVVDAYVSIMGILDDDDPPDLIENGAFVKSAMERGPSGANRIRTLWQHDWQEVVGRPLAIAEHPRDALPEKVLAKFPGATGGLYAKTQFVLGVQRGRESYELYKAGAMDEWSIGFDAITTQWEKANEITYRRIKEIKLWEYSPVTWGANPGTTTTSVKTRENQADVELVTRLKGLAQLIGLPDDLTDVELMEALEKRLRHGSAENLTPRNGSSEPSPINGEGKKSGDGEAEPPKRALTSLEVARLRMRLAEIQLSMDGR
jgi:uncharacterized protein